MDALCLLQALECPWAKAPAHLNRDFGSCIRYCSPCQTAAPLRQDLFVSHFVFIYSHYVLNANNGDLEDRLCWFLFAAHISMPPLRHYLNEFFILYPAVITDVSRGKPWSNDLSPF